MTPPRVPAVLRGRLREVDRWEWRAATDGGDPLDTLTGFLAAAGLPGHDLTRPPGPAGPGRAAGAAVLLGAGAVASADRPHFPAAPSPCPGVPDAVAVVYAEGPARPPLPAERFTATGWRSSWSDAEHATAVEEVRQAIARGELYQANLVRHRQAGWEGDPAAAGRALVAIPGTPYAGSLAGAGWSVHSASPEAFLTAVRGRVAVRPIKGTHPDNPDVLRASAKDRAEHVMIVDLERNDLGRVARTGAVRVTELYAVRRLAGLWHAESTVEAELRPEVGLGELLAATFPGGSVTGAPKLAALAEIARREPVGRGPSMGALGWVGADGTVDLGLTIRTVAITAAAVHVWTGGGVTWGSEPAAEVAEAEAKAAPLLAALAGT